MDGVSYFVLRVVQRVVRGRECAVGVAGVGRARPPHHGLRRRRRVRVRLATEAAAVRVLRANISLHSAYMMQDEIIPSLHKVIYW